MSVEPSISIGGIAVPLKEWSFEIDGPLAYRRRYPLPEIATGAFEVSGTVTCHFENAALLEEYHRRDAELNAFLRQVLLKPHKASTWDTAVPYLRRAAVVAILIAASLLLATGAA